jgi:hypothetical protein
MKQEDDMYKKFPLPSFIYKHWIDKNRLMIGQIGDTDCTDDWDKWLEDNVISKTHPLFTPFTKEEMRQKATHWFDNLGHTRVAVDVDVYLDGLIAMQAAIIERINGKEEQK